MIVISNPHTITNEIDIVHSLFEEGMKLFHIRKPNFCESEMKEFLNSINPNYRINLVLHSHHHLAEDYGINRLHFNENKRKVTMLLPNNSRFEQYNLNGFRLSTSTHSIEDFNKLGKEFDYAFLGPVFPSISKQNYSSKIDLTEAIKKRKNFTTQLIALGGIKPTNTKETIKNGFDCVALLGTIWEQNNAIKNFKLCQEIVQSF
jgi:thiamine-phosphate pyrophosphorylase